MSFAIDGTNGEDLEPVPCTLYLQVPDDVVDLAKWQFYNMKCQESGFYVSWGYLAASDAGIMTLVRYVVFAPGSILNEVDRYLTSIPRLSQPDSRHRSLLRILGHQQVRVLDTDA